MTVWQAADRQVCVRHRIWVGNLTPYPDHRLDLSVTTEIVHAAARANHLSRQHGRDHIIHCLDEAKQILGFRAKPDRAQARLQSTLFRTRQDLGRNPYLVIGEAADYPQRVALAAMLLSPYWRMLGSSAEEIDRARFEAELGRRVWPSGLASYEQLHEWMRYQRQRKPHTHGRDKDLFPVWLSARSKRSHPTQTATGQAFEGA